MIADAWLKKRRGQWLEVGNPLVHEAIEWM